MIDQRLAPYGALLLRLSLGVMWIAHGLLKILVFTLPGTAAFFEKVGYPGALAYVVTAAELVGGALILLGIHSRQVSVLMTPVMIGALLVHLPNGWLFTAPNGGYEYPLFLIAAGLAHAAIGEGAFALKPAGLIPRPRTA